MRADHQRGSGGGRAGEAGAAQGFGEFKHLACMIGSALTIVCPGLQKAEHGSAVLGDVKVRCTLHGMFFTLANCMTG